MNLEDEEWQNHFVIGKVLFYLGQFIPINPRI
jgi:hypothetical protein